MKVIAIFLLLFTCCVAFSIGLDMMSGKTLSQSLYSLSNSLGVMKDGEFPVLLLFLLLNFIQPYRDYRKKKKNY